MTETVSSNCLSCGAPLEFKPDSQSWICEYCSSEFTQEQIDKSQRSRDDKVDIHETAKEQVEQQAYEEFMRQGQVYTCTNCGAQIATDNNTSATFCMFCHNPTVISERISGDFRPAHIIPFKFSKDHAQSKFLQWCGAKPLVPTEFKSQPQLEKITGVYFPFWLYDFDADAAMYAKATRLRVWRMGDIEHSEVSHFAISRSGEISYSKIPADGSKRMDDDLMDQLEPFDYSELRPFSMAYFSGFFAEKYDVSHTEVYSRVENRLRDYAQSQLRETIQGYDSVNVQKLGVDVKNATADYAMLPVYLLNYKYRDKTYTFVLNGQTGKAAGKLPWSRKRAAVWGGAIAAAVTVVLFIGGLFI